MRSASLILLSWLYLWPAPVQADEASQRSQEAMLLHTRPRFADLEVWNRSGGSWAAKPVPSGKVLVVNLWARSCKPCLEEMPLLARIVSGWRGRREVEFLFIADGPAEMTRANVEDFWQHPSVDLPGKNCPGQSQRLPGSGSRCPLDLPDVDPWRATSDQLGTELRTAVKPITLFVDPHGFVRQVFVGSITDRSREFADSLERLLRAVASERSPGIRSNPPRKS